MKKALALVLSLILMLGTATTAFAANEPYQGYADMPVTAYSYGSFYLSIPESVEFTNYVNNACTISIGEYDIDTTDSIIVSIGNFNPNGGITMTHNTKEGVTADLWIYSDYDMTKPYKDAAFPLAEFTYDYLESNEGSDSFEFFAKLDESAKAGRYTGTIQFYSSIMQNS